MSSLFYLKSAVKGAERNCNANRTYRQQLTKPKSSVQEVFLDFNSDSQEIIGIVLQNISKKDGISKTKRLAYLNAFVKFMQHKRASPAGFNFDVRRICVCLRVCLVQEAPVLRSAAIRVLRFLLCREEDVIIFGSVGIPTLIARSFDIILNNAGERIQAIRLCQKILSIPGGAKHFPVPITRALISIGFDGELEQDKLHRSSLSLLCQLALVNPLQFIECGGVRVVLHNIFGCLSPMVLEGILGSLFHLLNSPLTRDVAGINLEGLVAPLTDLHFKHTGQQQCDRELNERELGFESSKIAIEILLRSWGGLGSFYRSGLQELVDSLYIEHFQIRRTILDLLCEIIGLHFPTWTDEVALAISAVDPSHPQDSWKLQEGFIVEEGMAILPHLATYTPNITANHTALLILCLVRRGLLEALVEVILTSDTFLSVRATVLLGELLCLSDHYLPVECFEASESIPSLLEHAMGLGIKEKGSNTSSLTPQLKQQRALEAITVLSLLHEIKAKSSHPSSMFLQMQISFAGIPRKNIQIFLDRLGELQLNRILRKEVDTNPTKLLKETLVLASKDPMSWQWETICCILRWCPTPLKRIEDSSWRLFLKRLVDFFKPSNSNFDRLELDNENSKILAQAGCTLFQFLVDGVQNFSGSVLLEEIVVDMAVHLDDLLRRKDNPHLAIWNPTRMETTLCQSYFLFIGKLSRSQTGIRVLRKAEILQRLVEVVRDVRHEDYVKLIVSSLYYGEEYARQILSIVLTSPNEKTRIYGTSFLRILVRIKPHNFSKWGAEFLVQQLGDTNPVIALTAFDILEEAVHDKLFLESLIALRPSFAKFGDRGVLLHVSFASLPSGYKYFQETNLLAKEIKRWRDHFNIRYVELVEVLVRDSVSTLRRGDDGKYPERVSKMSQQAKFKEIFVPPHLFGQLTQHQAGLDLLIEGGDIDRLIQTVNQSVCETVADTQRLKAALWSLSHFATSPDGLCILDNHEVIESVVSLGANCPILSVRHTVFHCLCLIASTFGGADYLRRLGWFAMPRTHHETYPIWDPTSAPRTSPSLKRVRDLDYEIEPEDELIKADLLSSSPGKATLENSNERRLSWLVQSDAEEKREVKDSSKGSDEVDSAPSLRNTPKHSFSKSIRKRLTSFTSSLSIGSGNETGSVDEELEFHESRSRYEPNWKMTKSKSDIARVEAEEEEELQLYEGSHLTPPISADFQQTLSPIQSSVSISGSDRRNSNAASNKDLKGLRLEDFFRHRVPSVYRSVIRKPIIRTPASPDSDIFPMQLTPQRRMSMREFKTGSLDRHIQLTPRDLFNESKLQRVNTSLTSISTPSYLSRPEHATKGPCFMGLCLPKALDMIFIKQSSLNSSFRTHVMPNPSQAHLTTKAALRKLKRKESSEGTGLCKFHDEIMRLISNMISCIGVKANEQALLRLKQKFPKAFQDIGTYSDVCDVISEYNVRLPLRRFLQELFFDLSYEEIYVAAATEIEEFEFEANDFNGILLPLVSGEGRTDSIEEQTETDKGISEEEDSDYIDLK